MLNPTTNRLIFIRVCITFLNYLPLLAIFLPPPLSFFLLALEAWYYFYFFRPFVSRLTQLANHPPDSREEREALFERCIENIPDPEKYLSLWALGAHKDDIKRDNVRDFLLWAFFDLYHVDITKDIEDELEGYINKTETLLGRPIPPGRGEARLMRLTFDDIRTKYRTVVWYLIVGLVDSVTHFRMLWSSGFHFYPSSIRTNLLHVFPPRILASIEHFSRQSPSNELSYWYRPGARPVRGGSSTLPIVFLHGVGIGLWPYIDFFSALPRTSPLLVPEILPICMRLTKSNILARHEFLLHLKKILQHHGIDRFVLVGHSYGTVLTTHVLHDPELGPRIEGIVLVDPITLLLHLPDVAFNFTKRLPKTANEWQLWYLASMDPGIALVLGRHFFWRENIIWKDELLTRGPGGSRRRAAVCLVSRDLIVDTITVARYLAETDDEGLPEVLDAANGGQGPSVMTRSGVELLWYPGLDHAQEFDRAKDYGRILDVMRRFCTET